MITKIRNGFETPSDDKVDVRVIIDIFRASTTAIAILEMQPSDYLIANDLKIIESYMAKSYKLVSEVFDIGIDNSPTLVRKHICKGDKVIHKTTNLTTAIEINYFDRPIIIAGFNNLSAVANYLISENFHKIEIIPAGFIKKQLPNKEDSSCADILKDALDTGVMNTPDKQLIFGDFEHTRTTNNWTDHYTEDVQYALKQDTSFIVPVVKKIQDSIFQVN